MEKSHHRTEPHRIGWNEFVDIPEWGIKGLRAKVDTGARSSALHVENIERLSRDRVRFDVVLHRPADLVWAAWAVWAA